MAFARPDIGDAEISAVLATLHSGWLTTGPRVAEFERQFAEYVGARHAVAVSSCTAALHLSLLAGGVSPGSEVVTTPLTFCATVNAIIHSGARPIFADIDVDTMNLSIDAVEHAVSGRTTAILPVHFGGRPVDLSALRRLVTKCDLRLIEDAAHALGAAVDGVKIGAFGDFTCFSFYSTKNLTTGEGGMVTMPSSECASAVRIASRHGVSDSSWSRQSPDRTPDYDVIYPGFKYNMTDMQAAIGLEQLARSTTLFARREAIWRRYDDAFSNLPIERPKPPQHGTVHARHLYTVLVDPERCGWSRDALQQYLARHGVQTSVHFRSLHLHSYYAQEFGLRRGMFPNAEFVSDRTLSLPLSSRLTDAEVDRVILVLRRAFEGPHA